MHPSLRGPGLRVFGQRLDIEVENVERVPAGRAVRAAARGVQGAHADSRRAEARGQLDQVAQVAEIADAPVARRTQAIELHRETPQAPAFAEHRGFVAATALDPEVPGFPVLSERLVKRFTGCRRDRARL